RDLLPGALLHGLALDAGGAALRYTDRSSEPVRGWTRGEDMTKFAIAAALAVSLALAGCTKVEADTPSAAQQAPVFELTPAVIAMRWQWLNPEINSFTFREAKDVFEYRDVLRGGDVWDLPRAE